MEKGHRFGPRAIASPGVRLGRPAAELVLHTMIEYPNYEKALIVSGDGDFYCLADYLKRQGKLMKIMIPNRFKFSSLLKKWMPDIVFINDLKGKLEFKR